ncbi:MAG: preprotein translocase subunit SecE [Candidatus Saccharimonadales bacterium]
MANVTRIKAKEEKPSDEKDDNKSKAKVDKVKKAEKTPAKVDKKASKAAKKTEKKADKKAGKVKKQRKIFAPFRYIRDSWRELRQVRWPDRKTTWKMTLTVIIYVIVFGAVITLLDAFFTFIFNLILGE